MRVRLALALSAAGGCGALLATPGWKAAPRLAHHRRLSTLRSSEAAGDAGDDDVPDYDAEEESQSIANSGARRARLAELNGMVPIDIQVLQRQLEAVRDLPRIRDDEDLYGRIRSGEEVLTDDISREPSFRRLFTHATWERYTGRSPLRRWIRGLCLWRYSLVSRAIFPIVCIVFAWASVVSLALPVLAPSIAARASGMWIPLSLQGTAIGLLVVFRTNNAYRRLEEAREQWGKLIYLLREVTTKASLCLGYESVADICRYQCAFMWSLRDKLRDGEERDDILSLLLSDAELEWVLTQRSRPLAILSRLRRLVYAEFESGAMESQMHYMIDYDLKEIDAAVEACERVFASPIPPNMARHGMRCLTLWICGLPVVLTNSMPWFLVALWTSITAYIFVGIDELGAQVEQPFKIMPLWQLCHLAQLNVEEALSTPDLPLRLNQQSKATPNPLACQSGNPFG